MKYLPPCSTSSVISIQSFAHPLWAYWRVRAFFHWTHGLIWWGPWYLWLQAEGHYFIEPYQRLSISMSQHQNKDDHNCERYHPDPWRRTWLSAPVNVLWYKKGIIIIWCKLVEEREQQRLFESGIWFFLVTIV
jgi:hypothetical protein